MSNLPNKIKSKLSLFLILFLLISIPVTVYFVKQYQETQDLRSKAAAPSKLSLTTEIPREIDRLKTVNDFLIKSAQEKPGHPLTQQTLASLRLLAQERKIIMLSFLHDNPDKFLENALPDEITKNLPQELVVEELIEIKKEVKGKLEVVIVEDLNNHKARYNYTLDDKNLYLPSTSEPLSGSGEVTVVGYSLDNNLVVYDASDVKYLSQTALAVSGNLNILVVRAQTAADPSLFDEQTLNGTVFGTSDSVAAYYSEVSRGLVSITGQITPIINITSSPGSCDSASMSAEIDQILKQQGYNLSDYRSIWYLLPGQGCSPTGLAILGGQKVWIMANDFDGLNYSWSSMLIHEFGHNLGLHHANSYECGLQSLGSRDVCIEYEYNDKFDVMGSTQYNTPHFNGPHKLALGWINNSEFIKLTNDQQIDLYAHESNEPGTKLVKIWRNFEYEYIYLSFRQPLGFDSVLPQAIVNGVNVHLTSTTNYNIDSIITRFIDAHPSTVNNVEDWYDAAMADGETLVDAYSNISINQISHTSSHVTVSVDIPDNYPPRLDDLSYVNGIDQSSDGKWYADPNSTIEGVIIGSDFSDAVNVERIVTYPDGSTNRAKLDVQYHNRWNPCNEIKCFIASGGSFVASQTGFYHLEFIAQDSQGAVSNILVYDFNAGIPTPTQVPPTSTPALTPVYTPTPSVKPTAKITPTPTVTPTPTQTPSLTPNPTIGYTALEPIADAFVNSQYPDNNSGTESELKVKSSPVKISYLKFDLTSLAGKIITSAKLRIWVSDPSSGTVKVNKVTNNTWDEKSITYNNRPTLGDTLRSFTAGTSGVYKEVDITGYTRNKRGGLMSIAIQTSSTNELEFRSRNVIDITKHPVLTIQ